MIPRGLLARPVAHRGLHSPGVPENSMAAFRAAIDAGYGIEMDIQPASDGTPLVFHDDELFRLTGASGPIAGVSVAQAAGLRLLQTDEAIPTLADVLAFVAGRVPLLIEIKDQDLSLGPNIGLLHKAVADALQGYGGPVAVMSFNPHVVGAFHALAPQVPVGLTTCGYLEADWPGIPEERRHHLAGINDFDQTGSCFVSHDKGDLGNPRLDALKAMGVPILCWTIRSTEEEAVARRVADNITFEGYRATV